MQAWGFQNASKLFFRKWTDLIEIAWEKRKETLLADLEKSGKSLTDALHRELNKTMAENGNMQNQKIQDQLGECQRMKGISSFALKDKTIL